MNGVAPSFGENHTSTARRSIIQSGPILAYFAQEKAKDVDPRTKEQTGKGDGHGTGPASERGA